MKDLIYNERTGEFETAGTNKQIQQKPSEYTQTSSYTNTSSTYYYIEGISYPHKWEQLRNMQLPIGTRIRRMLDNTWYPLEHFGLRGTPTYNKSVADNSNSRGDNPSTVVTNPIDSTYFYIEGEDRCPHKFHEIKKMLLPKGTKIRKMLDNAWYPIEHYGLIGVNFVQRSSLNNSNPLPTNKTSSKIRMRYEDSIYFYIEGETRPYKWSIIKNMHLPKGTRIRKMLDDKWIIFE